MQDRYADSADIIKQRAAFLLDKGFEISEEGRFGLTYSSDKYKPKVNIGYDRYYDGASVYMEVFFEDGKHGIPRKCIDISIFRVIDEFHGKPVSNLPENCEKPNLQRVLYDLDYLEEHLDQCLDPEYCYQVDKEFDSDQVKEYLNRKWQQNAYMEIKNRAQFLLKKGFTLDCDELEHLSLSNGNRKIDLVLKDPRSSNPLIIKIVFLDSQNNDPVFEIPVWEPLVVAAYHSKAIFAPNMPRVMHEYAMMELDYLEAHFEDCMDLTFCQNVHQEYLSDELKAYYS